MKDHDIIRFIKNELAQKEQTKVIEWIEKSEANRKRYNDLKNAWALSGMIPDPLWGNKADNTILHVTTTGSGARSLFTSIVKYAAIIMVTAGLSFYFFKLTADRGERLGDKLHLVTAPRGLAANVALADGSKVMLNSGSGLSYPANFSSKNRIVNLEGEAFFDINSDSDHPFIVTVSGFEIIATGTSFNVDAYPDGTKMNVTLVEGSVHVLSTGTCTRVDLVAGENMQLDRSTDEMLVSRVDTKFYTSWQQGIISFTNKRLEDIALDLERWYCVNISFESDNLREIRLTGTILKHKPIDQVLEILKLTSGFRYEITVVDNQFNRITIKE